MECLYTNIDFRIFDLLNKNNVSDDFYYCGTYTHTPRTDVEDDIMAEIDKLVDYAQSGHYAAIQHLLFAHDDGTVISLDPRAEYYFRKSAGPYFDLSEHMRDTSALEAQLSAGERAWLDEAAKAGDWDSVAATITSCPPRPTRL